MAVSEARRAVFELVAQDNGNLARVRADGSRELARTAAIHLARRIWEARQQFTFGCETAELEEGVSRALAAKERTGS